MVSPPEPVFRSGFGRAVRGLKEDGVCSVRSASVDIGGPMTGVKMEPLTLAWGSVTSARHVGHYYHPISALVPAFYKHSRKGGERNETYQLPPFHQPLVTFFLMKDMSTWQDSDNITLFERIHTDSTLIFGKVPSCWAFVFFAIPTWAGVISGRWWWRMGKECRGEGWVVLG